MNLFKNKKIIIIIVICILMICFLPMPWFFKSDMYYTNINDNDENLKYNKCTVEFWKLNYLFRNDKIIGSINIDNNLFEIKNNIDNYEGNLCITYFHFYNKSDYSINGGYIFFTKSIDNIVIVIDKPKYIITKDTNLTEKDITQILSSFKFMW